MAVRIGSPESTVQAGMPVPGKPGSFYEAGQFAPSIDQLLTSTLAEANDAGLVSTDLPIFDPDGGVSLERINAWNPYDDLEGIHAPPSIPKFSMATLITVDKAYPGLYKTLRITNIIDGSALENQEGANARSIAGEQLITAVTSAQGRMFRSKFIVYDRYYQYISTPIVPEIPGRSKGVSVSFYATLKALGHVMFARLAFDGELELIGKFLNAAEWAKTPNGGKKGHFMSLKNMAGYYLGNEDNTSEVSNYSPADDFADTFAQYLSHRLYLQVKSPNKLKVMDEICKKYRIG